MGFAAGKLFLIVFFVLIIFTLIVQFTGLMLDYWWQTETQNIGNFGPAYMSGGLWGACLHILDSGLTNCYEYEYIYSLPAWFNILRALGVMGVVFLALAAMCTVIAIAYIDSKIPKLLAWILCFVAFICILVEWAMFLGLIENTHFSILDLWTTEVPATEGLESDPSYAAAFVLTILADVLCIVCGVLGIISWSAKRTELSPI